MVRRAVLVVVAAGLLVATLAGQSPLRLVSTAWPPFTNPEGQPRFALDLVETALGRIRVPSATSFVEPEAFTRALIDGPFDGSAAAWRDAARERALVFSQPYLENRLVLVGRRGSDVSAARLADVAGRRIALVGGYSYGDAIELTGPVFVRSTREEDSLRMLLAGEVDYTLMDELVVQYILTHHAAEAQAQLALGTTPLLRRPLHLAVRRTVADAPGIVSRFNAEVRRMIVDRTYHRLLHVEWIDADIDGDGRTERIPASDQAGTVPPLRAYTLVLPETQPRSVRISPRYYLGGRIYDSWASVPDQYKSAPGVPAASRAPASVFTFVWK
jgi:polar amino acid transport system substrate-binding protein